MLFIFWICIAELLVSSYAIFYSKISIHCSKEVIFWKLDREVKTIVILQATVGFTLFGKESLVDLDVSEIVSETT